MHCWNWCAGWHPEHWPTYAALHTVHDWHLLTELMTVIRKHNV